MLYLEFLFSSNVLNFCIRLLSQMQPWRIGPWKRHWGLVVLMNSPGLLLSLQEPQLILYQIKWRSRPTEDNGSLKSNSWHGVIVARLFSSQIMTKQSAFHPDGVSRRMYTICFATQMSRIPRELSFTPAVLCYKRSINFDYFIDVDIFVLSFVLVLKFSRASTKCVSPTSGWRTQQQLFVNGLVHPGHLPNQELNSQLDPFNMVRLSLLTNSCVPTFLNEILTSSFSPTRRFCTMTPLALTSLRRSQRRFQPAIRAWVGTSLTAWSSMQMAPQWEQAGTFLHFRLQKKDLEMHGLM